MPGKKSFWASTAVIVIAAICGAAITVTAIVVIITSPAAHTSRRAVKAAPVTLAVPAAAG
jgi:H+/gluconate symporter-like permease